MGVAIAGWVLVGMAGALLPPGGIGGGADVVGPGPYRVGYRTLHVAYEPRGLAGVRELRVAVWYPTLDADGTEATYLAVRRPGVLRDASVAPGEELPVLVFSHGNGGIAEQSYFLTEHFASHGWVVLAPDHTGNTFLDMDAELAPLMFALRPQDVSAALDAAYGLADGDPLAGRLSDTVVMSGHSFGGYTTMAIGGAAYDLDAIARQAAGSKRYSELFTEERRALLAGGLGDPRVDALIPMAPSSPGRFTAEGLAALELPVLLVTGARDDTTTNAETGDVYWTALRGEHDLRLDMTNAGHYTFTNACQFGVLQDDGCGDDFMLPEDAFEVVRAYALAFADERVLGDGAAAELLEGRDELSDEVVLSAKPRR